MRKFLIFLGTIIVLVSVMLSYFIFTTNGSGFIMKLVLSKYVDSQDIEVKKIEGKLSEKLVFEDIRIEGLRGLPKGSVLEINKLEVYFRSFSLGGLGISIHNARLKFTESDAIVFYGNYKNSSLDINIYTKQVNVKELLDLFIAGKDLKKVSGTITDIDIYVKGSFLVPKLEGTFLIKELNHNGFSFVNSPADLNLTLKDIKGKLKVYGNVVLRNGTASGARIAAINLEPGKLLFSGDPKTPSLDLKGTANVEGTKINITLKGTFKEPNLKLTSDTSYSQERLLLLLVTGKSWKGSEAELTHSVSSLNGKNNGSNSGQLMISLSKDFLDYFIFGGAGSKLTQYFEARGISLKYDTKSMGAEYKITETISLGAEKELPQNGKNGRIEGTQKTNDKVILQYKKGF